MAGEVLAAAIDDLLTVDTHALSDAELHDYVVALEREASRFTAVRAQALADWDARRSWAEDGSKSARARLARDARRSTETAGRDLRRARALRRMPGTAAAFAAGVLTVEFVDLLVNARTERLSALFARDEAVLIGELTKLRYVPAERLVKYWKYRAEAEAGLDARDRSVEGRCFNADRTFEGGIHLNGLLPAVEGTGFLNELQRLEQQLFEDDLAEAREQHGDEAMAHLKRTSAQRRADALMLMARRSAALRNGSRLPVPLYTILLDYETAREALRVCQLEDGTVIRPIDAIAGITEADLERVVFDGKSRVIDVGVRTRFFTGALRRAIHHRRAGRCGTGSAKTPAAATNPSAGARSTTSRSTKTAGRPRRTTASSDAATTTDGNTGTRSGDHHEMRPVIATTSIAGAGCGNSTNSGNASPEPPARRSRFSVACEL